MRKIKTLSDLLKEARGERSFREMERRTGISHVYLIQLENGVDPRSSKARQPSLDTLKTLSDKLHIDFATILASVGFPQMLEAEYENERLTIALESILEDLIPVRGINETHDGDVTGLCIRIRKVLNGRDYGE